MRLYFIIVNFRIKENPEQQSTCILSSKHSFLADKKNEEHGTVGSPCIQTQRGRIRSVLFQKRMRPKSLAFPLNAVFLFLHWSEKGCWDITCGQVGRTAEHTTLNNTPPWEQAAIFSTMATTWALLNRSCKMASSGWKHIPGTFQVWINTKHHRQTFSSHKFHKENCDL